MGISKLANDKSCESEVCHFFYLVGHSLSATFITFAAIKKLTKMKIQYCSDLHLEFEDNLNFLSNCPIKRVGDILIIAGDLVPFVNLSKALYKSEIADLCKGFEKVFWLPGNHEYYLYTHHYASSRCEQPLKEVPNLYLVDNYSERIGNTQLILSTMWSHISKMKLLRKT